MIFLDYITHERKEIALSSAASILRLSKDDVISLSEESTYIKKLKCFLVKSDITKSELRSLLNKDMSSEILELSKEKWKDISGYEGKYQVSNLGRVRRIYKNTNPKICCKYERRLNGKNKGQSVVVVSLTGSDGKKKEASATVLVANAFIRNYDSNKFKIHKKDNNPYNTRLSNLMLLDKHEFGRIVGSKGRSKYVARLDQITFKPNAIYKNLTLAAKKNNTTTQSLSMAINKKPAFQGKHSAIEVIRGYRWMYIDDIEAFTDEYPELPIQIN